MKQQAKNHPLALARPRPASTGGQAALKRPAAGLLSDAYNIRRKDPAATSLSQVLLLYPGFHALVFYRASHWLYKKQKYFLARLVSQWGRSATNIEIHPGAKIGNHLFIDHGAGVVIGETAEVGDNVTIYHGVTLGGTGKHTGKRHPTIRNNVLLGAGVKVLGPIEIGQGSRIGANSTVLNDIPPDATAVGSPAVVVRRGNIKCVPSEELDQRDYPNIYEQRLDELEQKLACLEAELAKPKAAPRKKSPAKKAPAGAKAAAPKSANAKQ